MCTVKKLTLKDIFSCNNAHFPFQTKDENNSEYPVSLKTVCSIVMAGVLSPITYLKNVEY